MTRSYTDRRRSSTACLAVVGDRPVQIAFVAARTPPVVLRRHVRARPAWPRRQIARLDSRAPVVVGQPRLDVAGELVRAVDEPARQLQAVWAVGHHPQRIDVADGGIEDFSAVRVARDIRDDAITARFST